MSLSYVPDCVECQRAEQCGGHRHLDGHREYRKEADDCADKHDCLLCYFAAPSRMSSRDTAVGCHVSPRGALMPFACSSSAMPRTVVIPERLMSSTMPLRSAAR